MNAQAVATRQEQEVEALGPPSTALTPMQMAYQLAARGTDVATIKEMLAIGREMEAAEARRAFDAALAQAKAEIPVIRKNRHVGYQHRSGDGETDYWHEDLGEIAKTIDPILGKHGLSYRYRSGQADGRVVVTCVLSHRDGHFEETVLSAAPDASGKKNSIQQVGSAITYLQRYTLKMALGLAATRDDDGSTVDAPEVLIDEQVEEIKALIDKAVAARPGTDRTGWLETFLEYMKVPALNAIPAKDFAKAKSTIENAIKQGKK